MKKNLLTAGLLSLSISAGAQVVSTVDNGGVFFVGENALVYNGGGMQTRGTGQYDIRGNMMVVGGGTDRIQTLNLAGGNKTDGGNIVLRLNDPTNYTSSTYGQLYIQGLAQDNVTGIVDKEYRATKNGSMQQMALPFYNKTLQSLASNLGVGSFSNQRNNNAVGYWENASAVMHNMLGDKTTLDKAVKDIHTIVNNNAARYYAVGTIGWDPSEPSAAVQATSGGAYYTIKGQPFSDATPISYTLSGAGYSGGAPIPYGVGDGTRTNMYNERYHSYLQDGFDLPATGYFNGIIGTEAGTFGRNMYQFGNPFFTNIDLSTIGYNERTNGGDDGNNISSIQAVRYESVGVVSDNTGTHATNYKFISYDISGIPVGDFEGAIIKPMQAFVIKLRNNASPQTINFNTLRRFAYTARLRETSGQATNPYGVTANKGANSGSIKQLRVIGLDSSGDEVMRTYFVVNANAKTGHNADAKLQVSAYSGDLSTREELPDGGEDGAFSNSYYLYINEANEQDFFGKKIKMVADLSKITSYKFEIAENAVALESGESTFTDGGHSFYIEQTPGNMVKIVQNQILPATTVESGLYYGKTEVLGTDNIAGRDQLKIAYEEVSATQQVIFPKTWKKASINIYDLSGRLTFTRNDISTNSNFILPLKLKGVYMVEVISETGEKVVKKVIN